MTCFGSDATIGVLCPRLLDKASTALVPQDGDPPASGAPKPHKGCGFGVALFSLAVSTYSAASSVVRKRCKAPKNSGLVMVGS